MTIANTPVELRESRGRHRDRPTDAWAQELQRETRDRSERARHRRTEQLPSELRDNCRVDSAQHRACRGDDVLSA